MPAPLQAWQAKKDRRYRVHVPDSMQIDFPRENASFALLCIMAARGIGALRTVARAAGPDYYRAAHSRPGSLSMS